MICGAGGCAAAAKDLGKAAAPAAVQAGLEEANDADSQRQIQKLVDSGAFENAGKSIGTGVGIGLFDRAAGFVGLSPPGASSATQATTDRTGVFDSALSRIDAGVDRHVDSFVQSVIRAATDSRFREGEQAIAQTVGEGLARGMLKVLDDQGPRLAKAFQAQLGPTLDRILREQISPLLKEVLQEQIAPVMLQVWREGAVDTLKLSVRPDLQEHVITNAENASIGASQGTTKGLIEAGILAPDGGLAANVRFVIYAVVAALALIGLALFCLLVLLNVLVLRRLRQSRPAATS